MSIFGDRLNRSETEMTEGEVRLDEPEAARTAPPRLNFSPNLAPFGLESRTCFYYLGCLPIIGADFGNHPGNVGEINAARADLGKRWWIYVRSFGSSKLG